ncbi:MAG: efflux RND transporter permease subunit [Bacteroidales bacterium]|jgi:hydrophobe/amphiphile efflux-1 (HAE1) family protein|nr:efflux RND transporter permease subunit [Bacteroidales bacterium]
MNLKTFIERPILSAVISIVIVVMGIISLFNLPVERFPDIAPPTIYVGTSYFGANAETVQKSVIAPLEEAINGVENMTYMTSNATNTGSVSITIYFKQGTDPDMAAVNVQNRVSRAVGQLPAEVTRVGVSVTKRQNSLLQIFAIYSPDDSFDRNFISNYFDINMRPEILRISGVGDVQSWSSTYSMRIWLNPDVMAQYRLVPEDVRAALAAQNIEAATGTFGENTMETHQYTMKYKGRMTTPEEFAEIVIRSTPDGEVLKLKDLAHVEMGQDNYAFDENLNGHPGISCMISQTAGSNATTVNQQIDAFLAGAAKTLPKGMAVEKLTSSNDFLFASINGVVRTLLEAILLVILVVYIFLQDIRSTFIPLVGVAVSLVGTFAFMLLAGFSINLITLFALVLVIGTVVDDAIIVVEAVQARFDEGYRSPYMASIDAMKGISNAVISSSLVFMAVFIPVSFMSGTSGTFYTQFGLTMAVAVGISAINALTLSPALCALLLRPYLNEESGGKNNFAARFRKTFNAAFGTMAKKYGIYVSFFIRRRWLTGSVIGASIILLVILMNTTKTSLVPEEDQGYVFVNVTAAPGNSLNTTDEIMERLRLRLKDISQIKLTMKTTGYSMLSEGSAAGTLIAILKPWDERPGDEDHVQSVIRQIYARTADIKDASLFAMPPGMIPGYGRGNSLDINMQDKTGGDMNTFFGITQQYIGALNRRPEIEIAYSGFDVKFPQWQVEVDAAKCLRAGISPEDVLSTLGGYYGGIYASNFNRFSKLYRVMVQAAPEYRMNETSLDNTFVRLNNGEMAPLSQFVTLTKVYGAESLHRFNMYSSIGVSATPAQGYSTGDAINAVRETAAEALPVGYDYDFGGITREENQQSGTIIIIFGICLLMVYLILSALYESFLIPFAVLLSIPTGLAGSFLFAKIMGLENNIYLQTGLIMLIGLLAKTAILITEYAAERRRSGMSLVEAAQTAAQARLRPILMTVLAMIVGLLPLMFSRGAGANGNSSLGTGVVGGLLVGMTALLLLVPSLFIVFQWLHEKTRTIQVIDETGRKAEEEMP